MSKDRASRRRVGQYHYGPWNRNLTLMGGRSRDWPARRSNPPQFWSKMEIMMSTRTPWNEPTTPPKACGAPTESPGTSVGKYFQAALTYSARVFPQSVKPASPVPWSRRVGPGYVMASSHVAAISGCCGSTTEAVLAPQISPDSTV